MPYEQLQMQTFEPRCHSINLVVLEVVPEDGEVEGMPAVIFYDGEVRVVAFVFDSEEARERYWKTKRGE